MKNPIRASSIVSLACFFLLVGCESIYVPKIFGEDEVPPEVKAQPRLVEVAPPASDQDKWPRLGDVPSKPKDFSTKSEYDQSMDRLLEDRQASEEAKRKTLRDAPVFGDAALQDDRKTVRLRPPLFPK